MKVSFIAVLIAAAVIAGCKSSKTVIPDGEVEVKLPCSGPQFFTDNKNFRANAMGQSENEEVAKSKAYVIARNNLAQSIQTTVKTVTDNYTNSRSMDNKESLEQKFESLNREVVDQQIRGVQTLCETITKSTANGQLLYKAYVAIGLASEDLLKSYSDRISKDDQLKIDYDYEKFKDTFNKEMDKMSTKQPGGGN